MLQRWSHPMPNQATKQSTRAPHRQEAPAPAPTTMKDNPSPTPSPVSHCLQGG
ncbi:hypothetical protein L208DRAFT_1410609, partial [Tricholoma matsutake]